MSSLATHAPVCVTFRTSLPCELEAISAARVEIGNFLREQGVHQEEISACELALAEACNNAVQNATPEGRTRPVEIVAICTRSKVELHVIDHTAGFDWPETTEAPDWQEEHGRGLFFIQSFMDRASYFRGRYENSMVMRKMRASRPNFASPETDATLRNRLTETQQALTEMARELCFRSETLAAICRCSADLGRSNDLKGFAERLMNDLLHIAAAEWFVLRIIQPADVLTLFVGSIDAPYPDIPLASDKGISIEAESARLRRDVDFGPGRPLASDDALARHFPNASGLVHPIQMDEALLGTLSIGRSALDTPFSMQQREVIRTFADFLAIQLLNAQLREEQISTRLLSHEVEIARGIQQSLLPRQLPELPGFGLSAFCQSARQVGGDFYDVLQLSKDSVLLMIADVMGKGVPAAMFAALLRSLIRANLDSIVRPGRVLTRINHLLFEDLSGVNMFITAQLALVDLARRQLVVANAGHCPLLLAGGEGNQVIEVTTEGMPLGVLREAKYEEVSLSIPMEARLLLYTDGVTECRNTEGELFGEERLRTWLEGTAMNKTSESLKDELIAKLAAFEASPTLTDDRTFLIAAEAPPAEVAV
jgi:serine phosphatase RsbU (regulator of sigma subunit)/anti-sigma regulatory factor (Ser/Thr protein kinase)